MSSTDKAPDKRSGERRSDNDRRKADLSRAGRDRRMGARRSADDRRA